MQTPKATRIALWTTGGVCIMMLAGIILVPFILGDVSLNAIFGKKQLEFGVIQGNGHLYLEVLEIDGSEWSDLRFMLDPSTPAELQYSLGSGFMDLGSGKMSGPVIQVRDVVELCSKNGEQSIEFTIGTAEGKWTSASMFGRVFEC